MLVLRSRRRLPVVTEQWLLRTTLARLQLSRTDLNNHRGLATSTTNHKSSTRYAAVKKEIPVKAGYKPSLAERSDYDEALKIQGEARRQRTDEYQESLDTFGDGEPQG